MAFKEACRKAQPVLLEPIMKVTIIVPDEYMGDVMSDITARRGHITGTTSSSGAQQITCDVPLSSLFGYATDLRSRTQGRGQYVMEPSHYVRVPKALQEELVSSHDRHY
jgi:elongation factor G